MEDPPEWVGSRAEPSPVESFAPVQSFAPKDLLDADWSRSTPPKELAEAFHLHLRHLGAVDAGLVLALGKAWDGFGKRFAVADLGHSRVEDFALGRLGVSASQLRDARLLDRRLGSLPHLRRAFLGSAVSYTKARMVAAIATPPDDAGWTALAICTSTRPLRAAIAARRPPAAAVEIVTEEEERESTTRVSWPCTVVERAKFRGWGVPLLREIMGSNAPIHVLAEMLAADRLAALDDSEGEAPSAATASAEPKRRKRLRVHRSVSNKRLAALARRKRWFELPELPPVPDMSSATDAWEGLDVLRAIVALRERVSWERSRLLMLFAGHALHRELHMTLDGYVEHVLGMSPRDASRSMDMQGRLQSRPLVSLAWRTGLVSARVASMLVQLVEMRSAEAAWIDHALKVSFKRLDVERNTHLTVRGLLPWQDYLAATDGGRPDARIPYGKLQLDGRKVLAAGDDADDADADGADTPGDPEALDAARRALGRLVTCGFDAPPEVAALWQAAVAATRRASGWTMSDGQAVTDMLVAFVREHLAADALAAETVERHAIYERDHWQCQLTHCRSRGPLHAHHVHFKSRGGPDDAWNLVTLCEPCHRLVHLERVTIEGLAPHDLTVTIRGSVGGSIREIWRSEVRLG